MLSTFNSMGLIVTSDLWSELQEYGLLEGSSEAMVAFEEIELAQREARSGHEDENNRRSVPEGPEAM